MEEKTLIKKGAVVFVYRGQTTMPLELVVGKDILTKDSNYVIQNGVLKVSMKDIESAVEDYMLDDYYANDYYFDVCEDDIDDEFYN